LLDFDDSFVNAYGQLEVEVLPDLGEREVLRAPVGLVRMCGPTGRSSMQQRDALEHAMKEIALPKDRHACSWKTSSDPALPHPDRAGKTTGRLTLGGPHRTASRRSDAEAV
jgi:hypothetical protein